jgi:hypothetical protein
VTDGNRMNVVAPGAAHRHGGATATVLDDLSKKYRWSSNTVRYGRDSVAGDRPDVMGPAPAADG